MRENVLYLDKVSIIPLTVYCELGTNPHTNRQGEEQRTTMPPSKRPSKREKGAAIILSSGKRLRDEFVCPITRDLMRYPVLAADGFTYDKDAVEGWLKRHETSPMTGERMTRTLIPNHNLRKLILDLTHEGGEGLYITEDGTGDSVGLALVRQKVLVLSCLGPAESCWNGRRYRVRECGTIGGRKMPDNLLEHSFMSFSDNTVSRAHFLINFMKEDGAFYYTDLGSAGGSFFRVSAGSPETIRPGSMIMFGKHQLEVFDPRERSNNDKDSTVNVKAQSRDDIDEGRITVVLAKMEIGAKAEEKGPAKRRSSSRSGVMASMEEGKEGVGSSSSSSSGDAVKLDPPPPNSIIGLRCFAPEGTPLQDRVFYVGATGASIGRKQSNAISFSRTVDDKLLGIDNSISGEHACLEYLQGNTFNLRDGAGGKVSTNGSWIRMSKTGVRSRPMMLKEGMEILIGTVRFVVNIEDEVIQKGFDEMEPNERAEMELQLAEKKEKRAKEKDDKEEMKGDTKR